MNKFCPQAEQAGRRNVLLYVIRYTLPVSAKLLVKSSINLLIVML
ncbi:hypothetical protein BN1182_AZ_01290 [Pantoea ananatis]|nr:hypothetical protein BN1182_AZ_01290 [Pantoea ananatis]